MLEEKKTQEDYLSQLVPYFDEDYLNQLVSYFDPVQHVANYKIYNTKSHL